MKQKPHILQMQSGGGITGGIAGYISVLVGSDAMKSFDFTVTVGPGETENLRLSGKYHRASTVETSTTYGLRSLPSILISTLNLIKKNKITLIHSHALRSGLICAILNILFGIRYIHTNHGLRFKQKSGSALRIIFRLIEFFVISRAELIFCIRKSDALLLQKIVAPHVNNKIKIISTRVDTIKRSSKYPRTSSLNSRPTIIGVGSLIDVKRVDRFIDWIAALSSAGVDYEAVWLGDGPLRNELENYAKKSNVRISWLGQVPVERVSAEFERADLMLLTSDFEVLPLAALEAMGRGVPIITTNFFGVTDFVTHNVNGMILSKSASASDISCVIAELLNDLPRLEYMHKCTLAVFEEKFSNTQVMAKYYAAHYLNVLESSR